MLEGCECVLTGRKRSKFPLEALAYLDMFLETPYSKIIMVSCWAGKGDFLHHMPFGDDRLLVGLTIRVKNYVT